MYCWYVLYCHVYQLSIACMHFANNDQHGCIKRRFSSAVHPRPIEKRYSSGSAHDLTEKHLSLIWLPNCWQWKWFETSYLDGQFECPNNVRINAKSRTIYHTNHKYTFIYTQICLPREDLKCYLKVEMSSYRYNILLWISLRDHDKVVPMRRLFEIVCNQIGRRE